MFKEMCGFKICYSNLYSFADLIHTCQCFYDSLTVAIFHGCGELASNIVGGRLNA